MSTIPNKQTPPTASEDGRMPVQSLLTEPGRVDEPSATPEFANVLSRVAAEGRAIFAHPKGTHGVLLELLEKSQ